LTVERGADRACPSGFCQKSIPDLAPAFHLLLLPRWESPE
jgi:hypothetical protein